MSCAEMRPLIEGYFDHELDLVRSLEIEKHVESCTACAEHLKHLQGLNLTLHAARLHEAAPERLRRWAESLGEPRAKRVPVFHWDMFHQWGTLGVAAFAGAALWIGVPLAERTVSERQVADEIVSAHVRSLMAGHLTDVASTHQHTVKPWFSGKVDFAPFVRDFDEFGFALKGGRLEYVSQRPAAALVYQHHQHIVNLILWPAAAARDRSSETLTRRGYNLVHWIRSGMTYWAISDLNSRDLQQFVQIFESQAVLPGTS